jgi:hypothetical protein
MNKRHRQKLLARLVSILEGHGAACTLLDEHQAESARERWRAIYAKPLFVSTGLWVRDGFDWHIFSFGDAPALEEKAALAAYASKSPPELLLLSAGPHVEFGLRATIAQPQLPTFDGVDVLVFPPSARWTMVFTHEVGCFGPYFAEATARPRVRPHRSSP